MKWNQNEKSVKWPGNEIPIFFFIFRCPVEVQLCRENTYLHRAGINSDVHLTLLELGVKTNAAGNFLFLPEKIQPSISKF